MKWTVILAALWMAPVADAKPADEGKGADGDQGGGEDVGTQEQHCDAAGTSADKADPLKWSYTAAGLWQRFCVTHRGRGAQGSRDIHLVPPTDYIVCADLTKARSFIGPSTWNRLEHPTPHSEVLLVVKGDPETEFSVEAKGTRGIYVAQVVWPQDSKPPPEGDTKEGNDPGRIENRALSPATAKLIRTKLESVGIRKDQLSVTLPDGMTAEQLKEVLADAKMWKDSGPVDIAKVPEAKADIERLVKEGLRSNRKKCLYRVRNFHRFKEGDLQLSATIDAADPDALVGDLEGLEAAVTDARETGDDELTSVLTQLAEERGRIKNLERVDRKLVDRAQVEIRAAVDTIGALTRGDDDDVAAQIEYSKGLTTALTDLLKSGTIAAVTSPATLQLANLSIDPTYAGTLRTGIGVGLSNHADYTVDQALRAGGDDIYVVQEESRGLGAVDILIGYSHFVRRRPSSSGRLGFAITGGVSVATFEGLGEGPKVLNMAYLGGELGWKQFGLGLVFTARMTESLRDGLEVGDPVRSGAKDEDLTTSVVSPGVSLHFYPFELLKLGGK